MNIFLQVKVYRLRRWWMLPTQKKLKKCQIEERAKSKVLAIWYFQTIMIPTQKIYL